MVTPMRSPEVIYKVVSSAAFAAARDAGTFTGASIDLQDGFIHLSTAAQLPETLSLHFRGQSDLMLFALRTKDVGGMLLWETSRGGKLFPHVYGTFPMSIVAWSAPISVGSDGSCQLPEAVK
jgi:uncharacterized protein (DUF952 family)